MTKAAFELVANSTNDDAVRNLQQQRLEVHFNPASLQLTVNNTLQRNRHRNQPRQSTQMTVQESAAKLTLELVFDTTGSVGTNASSGTDVRAKTRLLEAFMGNKGKIPPKVKFLWGQHFEFQGVIESLRETVEFFSEQGIPLRSVVNVTMTRVGPPPAPGNQPTSEQEHGSLGRARQPDTGNTAPTPQDQNRPMRPPAGSTNGGSGAGADRGGTQNQRPNRGAGAAPPPAAAPAYGPANAEGAEFAIGGRLLLAGAGPRRGRIRFEEG